MRKEIARTFHWEKEMMCMKHLLASVLLLTSACSDSGKEVDAKVAILYDQYFTTSSYASKKALLEQLRNYLSAHKQTFQARHNFDYAYGIATARLALICEALAKESHDEIDHEKVTALKQEAVSSINRSLSESGNLTWREVETLLSEFNK